MAKEKKEEVKVEDKFRWKTAIWVVLLIILIGYVLSGIFSIFVGGDIGSSTGNVAKINVVGTIITDDGLSLSFSEIASSSDIVEQIEKADRDPSIKAIIIEINSPGGSAVASAEIGEALERTNKTTVGWIRDIGTSGAYWVASATDHVVANRASITGSIGVIASYLEFDEFLDEHNVSYRRLVSGRLKDIGSPLKEMTSEEEEIFQKNLDSIREYFVEEVAKNRRLKKTEIDKVATGVFYIGSEAKSLGLVDELGGKYDVIEYIEEKEGIEVDIVDFNKKKGFFELFGDVIGKQFFRLGEGISSGVYQRDNVNSVRV